ncbi:energy transducer TonB [Colwellia sp. MB3u-70]|nr:energy transducer TonB [Colwellia sp. MB3u-8]MBA6307572.1 energy transducer TonB [Colwellia sp. MB3u-70]
MAMAASGGDLKQRVVRLLDQQQHCTKTADTGKWLASFTILLSIIFLLSKYSLTLPIIDLQSGSISLHNPVTGQNKNSITPSPETFQQTNANPTLASHLLARDHTSTRELPAEKKVENLAQAINKKQKSNKIIAKNKLDALSDHATSAYYNDLPFVRVNPNNKKNVAQHHAELQHETQVNQQPDIASKKSISTLAFERTDSTYVGAEANPYKQQINSLLNEPITSRDTPITALNRGQFGTNYQQQTANKFSSARLSQSQLTKSVIEHQAFKTSSVTARLINSAEPKYPSSAKRKGIELEIMVEFSIDRNGLVKDIQFESKSKVSYFRNTIRNAMEKWRFLPAKENGRAVASTMSKIFSFRLLK